MKSIPDTPVIFLPSSHFPTWCCSPKTTQGMPASYDIYFKWNKSDVCSILIVVVTVREVDEKERVVQWEHQKKVIQNKRADNPDFKHEDDQTYQAYGCFLKQLI